MLLIPSTAIKIFSLDFLHNEQISYRHVLVVLLQKHTERVESLKQSCVKKLFYELFSIILIIFISFRSSHWRCSVRKSVLKNFAKFTGKHLCQSHFFNKVVGWGLQLYLKRYSGAGAFTYQFSETSKNTYFIEHLCVAAFDHYVLKCNYCKCNY